MAWNFVNDSLRTSLLLQYRPPLIAAASLQLAAKYCEKSPTSSFKLPDDFLSTIPGADKRDMEGSCESLYFSRSSTSL